MLEWANARSLRPHLHIDWRTMSPTSTSARMPRTTTLRVASWICCTFGGVMFSQGLSFAMPGPEIEERLEDYLRLHAWLLAGGGIALVFAGIAIVHLTTAVNGILEGSSAGAVGPAASRGTAAHSPTAPSSGGSPA